MEKNVTKKLLKSKLQNVNLSKSAEKNKYHKLILCLCRNSGIETID